MSFKGYFTSMKPLTSSLTPIIPIRQHESSNSTFGKVLVLLCVACFCLLACGTKEAAKAPPGYLATLNAAASAVIVGTWTSAEPAAGEGVLQRMHFSIRIDAVISGALKPGQTIQCESTMERGYRFPEKGQKLLFLVPGKGRSTPWTVIDGAIFDPECVKSLPLQHAKQSS